MAFLNTELLSNPQVMKMPDFVGDFQTLQANKMKLNAAKNEMAQAAKFQQLRQQAGGDIPTLIKNAGAAGFDTSALQKDYDASQQSQATTAKTQFGNSNDKITALNNGIASVISNPTPQNATGQLAKLFQFGLLSEDQLHQTLSTMPTDAEGIKSWAQSAALSNMEKGGQLAATNPKTSTINLNDKIIDVSVDPLTGQATTNNTYQMGVSPNTAASNQVSTENSIRQNDTTRAGQQLSAKTASSKIEAKANQVLPTAGLKLVVGLKQNYDLADAASKKMSGLVGLVDTAKFGPMNNLVSASRNYWGMSNPQSQAFERIRAGINDAVNTVLTAAKGVQTDGDAKRAEKIIIASNANDPTVVKQAMKDLIEFSDDVKTRTQNQIDGVYANFGQQTDSHFGGKQEGQETTVPNPTIASPAKNISKIDVQRLATSKGKTYAQALAAVKANGYVVQ